MRPIDVDEILAKIDKVERIYGDSKYIDWDGLRYFLGKFDTLDVGPPVCHAKWQIDHGDGGNKNAGRLYCPVCLTYAPSGRARVRPKYCDECGAKMDLE